MCWFAVVVNIWGFLATSHFPTTANYSLANKPYFCLGLLANLADLLSPVGSIPSIFRVLSIISLIIYLARWNPTGYVG